LVGWSVLIPPDFCAEALAAVAEAKVWWIGGGFKFPDCLSFFAMKNINKN
jgi:hypothetical protein